MPGLSRSSDRGREPTHAEKRSGRHATEDDAEAAHRAGRHHQVVLLHVDQQLDVDELVGEQRLVLVVELGAQLEGAGELECAHDAHEERPGIFGQACHECTAQLAQIEAQIRKDQAQLEQAKRDTIRADGLLVKGAGTAVQRDTNFTTEKAAIAAIKVDGDRSVVPSDILVLCCRGPMGSGMEETYQLTSALKYLKWGKHVAVITDARFSGVSTGACIGHVSPEALAGGPLGRLRDGDRIEIVIDRNTLAGTLNYVGPDDLGSRTPHPDLRPDPRLPDHTRLWAALQDASGGTWGGAVYDVDAILSALAAGSRKLKAEAGSRKPGADS